MYNSCELYIDDILIFGETEEEFCIRLEQVLKRFLEHKITVNPDKVDLGLDKVEFLGHTLDSKGLHFTREKLDKVLQISIPAYGKELKSFLGVCVYFKDHIAHYSDHVRLLHHMIRDYDKTKNRRLTWTDAATVAFHTIKQLINDLPVLFFVDDDAEIFLRTDASDYGIGAYLYQKKDGVEIPVGFMSKMLSDRERRWNVTEKECYAIVAAFDKFYYTLRDRKFLLQTDHRNLQFMDKSSNAKIIRWKMMISEFDCIVEHIPGRNNIVADGFSRILPIPEEECNILTDEYIIPSRGFADLHGLLEEELSALYDFFIPIEERDKIEKAHNSSVGHFGLEKTLGKLDKLNFQWKYRREHVKRFIKECPHCQKQSYLKIPICTHPFTLAAYHPMERLAIDTIGPLPKSEEGYEHIMVVLDCFTRWVELYPLKDVTAPPAAKALINHFATFSQPSQIIHDNGSQFKNELLTEMLELTGVQQVPILAYSSEENGMVERANREVMRHLRAIIFDKNIITDWESHLPQVKRIMNSSKHLSTGVSPSQLLFGNAIQLDPCILEPRIINKESKDKLSKWAAHMLKAQDSLISIAKRLQKKRDEEYMDKATENQLSRPHEQNFGIGTYVLVEYKSSKYWKGPPNKLMTNKRGPLKIIAIDKDVVTLENLVTRRNEKIHISNLTPFIFNPLAIDPLDVARKDYHSTFIIEKILEHKGSKTLTKSKWDFKVRWLGYNETDDLWIPYSEVRDNALFHDYVRINKLPKNFIPLKHQTEVDRIRIEIHEHPKVTKRGRPKL
jgi:transposase InsO family protein